MKEQLSTGLCLKGMLMMHVSMVVSLISNCRFCRSYCKLSLAKSERSTLLHHGTYD